MQASDGKSVRIHYTGKLDDGTTFDSSRGREPLQFTLGERQVIPGFETAVRGMQEGESRTVTIPADQAYGRHRPELVHQVPQDQVPAGVDLTPGARLEARAKDGRSIPLTVVAVEEGTVRLDANHPLAGQDLTFDIELLKVA
jgi:peptidylprolyl isomerase